MQRIILIFLVFGICHIFLPQASATLDDGLVAFYPFNGNANDVVGGYNGTVIGDTALTEDRLGNPNSAYSFDGSGDYINIGTALNFPSWPVYSVSVWFLNDGGGVWNTSYGQKIIDKTVFWHDFYITLGPPSGFLRYFTYESGGAAIDDYGDFRDNLWHHVVVTKDGSHGEMWVDGLLTGTTDNAKTVYSGGNLLFGYCLSSDSLQRRYWSGKIDDIRIYERVLSDSEIEILHLGYFPVSIDIKPGSDPNCFNINGHGVIPVAIFGSSEFDVSEVNTTNGSLSFNGLSVRVRGNKGPLCSMEFSDEDEFFDLVCHFEDEPGSWVEGNDTATLTGELYDGTPIRGTDSICIVP